MTTVSGIVRDTQGNALAGLQVTISYLRPLVGSNGGAAVENTRVFTTSGTGLLTMPDLLPGRYSISISVPVNSLTVAPIELRSGTLTVLDQDTQALESALDETTVFIEPSALQQAFDARDQAEAFASTAVAASQQPFPDRATAVTALADLPAEIVRVGWLDASGRSYYVTRQGGATAIPDMPGWVPDPAYDFMTQPELEL